MTEAEKRVREAWKNIIFAKEKRTYPAKDGTWTDFNIYESHHLIACAANEAEAWAAARAFTENREKQIAEHVEEIEWLSNLQNVTHMNAAIRLLRKTKSELEQLQRGMVKR